MEAIFKRCDIYAKIKYEDKQTNVIPKVKLSFLLGLMMCHKNGTVKINIGYAEIP